MSNSKLKCRYCKEYFKREEMITTPKGSFCTDTHAAKYAIASIPKARKKQKKEEDRAHRERKKELKPITHWLRETQKVFNRLRLLELFDQPCWSCGAWDVEEFHAGHYRSIGAASHLRFTPDNVWKQCSKCNTHLSGNIENYRIKLINTIGLERVEALENDNSTKSWTREELEELRKVYRAKIKAMNC